MIKKKVVFFGLGGAGQRHLRILYKFKEKFNLNFYALRKIRKFEVINENFTLSNKKLFNKYRSLIYLKKKEAFINMGFAIICNPSSHHYITALKCIKNNMNTFVEKPFFCSIKDFYRLSTLIKKKKLKFLVGYQKRFSDIIKKTSKLIDRLDKKSINTVKVIVNSYLPGWHKYEDFKTMYASKKSLGGGSLLTESHELDIILMFFGIPDKIYCKKYYDIKEINVESRHEIILIYPHFSVFFKVNMFSKRIKRNISIVSKKSVYKVDLLKNKIYNNNNLVYFKDPKIVFEKDFKKQMYYFISNKTNINKSIIDTMKNLIVLHSCNKSHRLNKIIKIRKYF